MLGKRGSQVIEVGIGEPGGIDGRMHAYLAAGDAHQLEQRREMVCGGEVFGVGKQEVRAERQGEWSWVKGSFGRLAAW